MGTRRKKGLNSGETARWENPADEERYEALRQSWLERQSGWAVVLVVHRGLWAWLRACPHEVRARHEHADNEVPQGWQCPDHEVVDALVDLILHRRQEAVA